MGRQDHGGPARCRPLGDRARDRRPPEGGCDGRQLRRLFHAGRADHVSRDVRLRGGPGRSVQPDHPAGNDTAVLETHARAVHHAGRRSPHAGGSRPAHETLAAHLRGPHPPPLADRPGRQRSPGEAGRVGPDREGHAGQGIPVTYVLYSDEGPRLCAAGEQPVLQRHRRGLSWPVAWAAGTSRSATISEGPACRCWPAPRTSRA